MGLRVGGRGNESGGVGAGRRGREGRRGCGKKREVGVEVGGGEGV